MTKRSHSFLLWLLAIVLTLVLAVFQRTSGPTYPIRGQEKSNGFVISYRLLRSHIAMSPLPVTVIARPSSPAASAKSLSAWLNYRRYRGDQEWTSIIMSKTVTGEQPARITFNASIPGQPAAGKVEYKITINTASGDRLLHQGRPAIARFRGPVPAPLLIAHIMFMFLGMLLALRTGLEALRRRGGRYDRLVSWTLAVTLIGGFLLGPLVQKCAFGAFWTGFPLGTDLTDNKILLAVIFWLAAFFLNKRSRWWVVAAAVLMVIVYLIPHSLLGSELDYRTGKMTNTYSGIERSID